MTKKQLTGSEIMAADRNKLFGYAAFRHDCGKQADELYRVEAFLVGLKIFAPLDAQTIIGGCIFNIEKASRLLMQVANNRGAE